MADRRYSWQTPEVASTMGKHSMLLVCRYMSSQHCQCNRKEVMIGLWQQKTLSTTSFSLRLGGDIGLLISVVTPFHGKSHSSKICCYWLFGRKLEQIAAKEFWTNWSKRYQKGGQYRKIGLCSYFAQIAVILLQYCGYFGKTANNKIFDECDELFQ